MRSRILGILNRLFWLCYLVWVILVVYFAPWGEWITPSYPTTLGDVKKYSPESLRPDPKTHTLTDAQVEALARLDGWHTVNEFGDSPVSGSQASSFGHKSTPAQKTTSPDPRHGPWEDYQAGKFTPPPLSSEQRPETWVDVPNPNEKKLVPSEPEDLSSYGTPVAAPTGEENARVPDGLKTNPLPWKVKLWRDHKSILETLCFLLAPVILRRALIWVAVGR